MWNDVVHVPSKCCRHMCQPNVTDAQGWGWMTRKGVHDKQLVLERGRWGWGWVCERTNLRGIEREGGEGERERERERDGERARERERARAKHCHSRAFNCNSLHCFLGRSQGGRQIHCFSLVSIDTFDKPMSPNYQLEVSHAFCCGLVQQVALTQCQIVVLRICIPGGS